jgi:hypothetical protein
MLRYAKYALAGLILIATVFSGNAQAFEQPEGPCTEQDTVKSIIWCASNYFDVSTSTALDVAECESGYYRFAVSDSGTYLGVYQQSRHSWRDRFRSYIPRDWFPNTYEDVGAFNARANILVSMKMARSTWSPWSGCL